MDFIKRLNSERLIFDGAMGTMLQAKGIATGEVPELWNMTHSDVILDIHRSYITAGAHVLKTNTFGANRLKLAGSGYSVDEVVSAAVGIAKEAAKDNGAFVALDLGPIGKLLAPFGDLEFEEAVSIFADIVKAGAKAGADFALIETMSDTYEIKAAMLAVKENSSLPICVTFTLDAGGRLLTGGDIPSAVTMIEALGADALGFNCGLGPVQMKAFLPELLQYTSIPIIINPNAGMPERRDGETVFPVAPDEFAALMTDIAAHVQAVGGCCGTTPAHIKAVTEACRDIPYPKAQAKAYTAVSSYGKTVFFGNKTVIIGERLNPTGKPRMKRALLENDMDYICREGLAQIEHGAQILDVNVGLPGIDEADALARAVYSLQSVTDAVLQIDTSSPEAAERALRLYNGKPLLNSVSGKKESLDAVLPLVKKYGAAVVALALDDEGIPETASDRVQAAAKIIEEASRYGIAKKDIIADALTLTVSTGADSAQITLDALDAIRRELGIHTVLGVSNISFGLPEREHINAAFFTLAMGKGLGAGIVNPMNAPMMDAYYSYNALRGFDANCADYIERFSSKCEPKEKPKSGDKAPSLFDSIVYGLKAEAGKAALAMAAELPPLEMIEKHLIPALDKVGMDFENQVIFLPQLLMSAESAKSAFEAIKTYLAKEGKEREKRDKIVLATVWGDIHDIGKNIVKILLENYNFDVIDLGRNVEPSAVVDAVIKENARLAGLSALMTTTVANMEETIRLLKEKAPECRVMVGGAVLTEEYAEKIGADFYAKDAMGSVRYADDLFTK